MARAQIPTGPTTTAGTTHGQRVAASWRASSWRSTLRRR
jgi:hypothetical protein